jgi:hypothetical protein
MDADRFDNLLRSLSTTPTRRRVMHLLSGTALASLLTLSTGGTDAKKKGGKKTKKCKGKEKVTICHKGQTIQVSNCALKVHQKHGDKVGECPCVPQCAATNACGDNGCGVSCGSCRADQTCSGTTCACPPGQEESGGVCGTRPNCIPKTQVCTGGPTNCCSDSCPGTVCACSQTGEDCLTTTDCCIQVPALTCVGFHCVAPPP